MICVSTWNFLRVQLCDLRRGIFWSHSLISESADVSLVFSFFVFSDIPRAFIHKLRAFIGEPKAFFPEHVF